MFYFILSMNKRNIKKEYTVILLKKMVLFNKNIGLNKTLLKKKFSYFKVESIQSYNVSSSLYINLENYICDFIKSPLEKLSLSILERVYYYQVLN